MLADTLYYWISLDFSIAKSARADYKSNPAPINPSGPEHDLGYFRVSVKVSMLETVGGRGFTFLDGNGLPFETLGERGFTFLGGNGFTVFITAECFNVLQAPVPASHQSRWLIPK